MPIFQILIKENPDQQNWYQKIIELLFVQTRTMP